MMKLRELAKKAMAGDGEATDVILITIPKGMMKGMDPMEFIQKFASDMEFGGDIDEMEDGMEEGASPDYAEIPETEADYAYKAKHKAILEALDMAGVPKKDAMDIADKVCSEEEDTTDMPSA
jgi:hypothetical protein